MEMQLTGAGTNSFVETQVDPTHMALRASIRPQEHIINGVQGGHYSLVATTGSMAAIAASGQILAVRWNDPNKIMMLHRLTVSSVCTAFSAGTGADLEAVRASSYTTNASGGTAITPSTTSQMLRVQNMAMSSFNAYGELRIATTAALTAGTQTLDTAGFGGCQLGATGAGGGAGPFDIFAVITNGGHPLVITNNQGFVVRAITAVPASNNFRYTVKMAWFELAAY